MRDALLRDLVALNTYEIITTHDARLAPSCLASQSIAVKNQFVNTFKEVLSQVDLVWLIAPEADDTLLDLSKICYQADVIFLGCRFDATRIGTNKLLTYNALKMAKIDTVPVIPAEDFIADTGFEKSSGLQPLINHRWVAKPKDGAGCEGIKIFDSAPTLIHWLKPHHQQHHYLVQPYQAGLAASFSMVCKNTQAYLLSCNQQHIELAFSTFKLKGITVNGVEHYWSRFESIAQRIAKMLPDAAGYIGVDVIIDTQNDKIYVIEINPRLSTSYVGLREAIGHNPAKIILDCFKDAPFTMPKLQRNKVEITL